MSNTKAQNKAAQKAIAPLSASEIKAESTNEDALFRIANKVVADCKGRDHVRHFSEKENGRTQTGKESRGLGLRLGKDAPEEVSKRQAAIAGLEVFLDNIGSVFKSADIDDSIVHLRKLVKGLPGKQKETLLKLETEAAVAAAMK